MFDPKIEFIRNPLTSVRVYPCPNDEYDSSLLTASADLELRAHFRAARMGIHLAKRYDDIQLSVNVTSSAIDLEVHELVIFAPEKKTTIHFGDLSPATTDRLSQMSRIAFLPAARNALTRQIGEELLPQFTREGFDFKDHEAARDFMAELSRLWLDENHPDVSKKKTAGPGYHRAP